ncbi:penicillin-binding protein [Alteribacillus persepolensis]|uniref:Penicillin-binding protein n=1 Tax=Alteribacillus persepolensis TaxID=568899 RepID=A0A1G8BET1_9BACI|nr:transglycosylase domain-containing protein [Alteribacillus persepolensis]SDH31533.1 penicillin-binding protein [Alteribacillus persepolensis]
MHQFFEKLNRGLDQIKNHPFVKGLNITSHIFWNLLLIGAVLMVMLVLFAGSAGAGYFISLVEDQQAYSKSEFQHEIYNYEEVSDIYFDDDTYLGEFPADLERKERPLEDMSEHLIHAVISTEDEYFFEHQGIVPKALLRATYQEVTGASNQTGGSTLSQQVIKNQLLTNEVSFERKAKEIALALRMEQFLDKEEILEAYLNIVPFGRNADGRNIAGAQSAAEGIFGVDVSELNIAQAAFIAGLPQNPFTYTPFENNGNVKENFEAGLNRMQLVLRNMLENNFITEEEYEKAKEYDIRAHLAEPSGSLIEEYPYLTYETQDRAARIIREKLLEEDNVNVEDMEDDERQETLSHYYQQAKHELAHGGYNVHITIKKDIYDAMQRATAQSQWFGPTRQINGEAETEEVGAILIDNDTGAILSFVGGRDFERENLNHATQAYRQNGSTMKPLLAYGPAMEQGIVQPGTILPDVPSTYQSTGGSFRNAGDSYSGLITVREALKRSKNVPAVKTFERLNHDVSRQALLDMGFNRLDPGEPYNSAPIGGLTYGTTVETNTNAFTIFGDHGQYKDSYFIEKIETKDGETVYQHEVETNQVFSPQTAFLMTDVLRDVLEPGGTAGSLPGRMRFGGDWAGKTGTSNETKDSWFVGYNPNVTFGIWIGYDTPRTITSPYKGLSYGARTQQIWADMMNAAYEANADVFRINDQFEQPDGIVRQTICGISGKLPDSLCLEAGLTTTDYFNAAYVPTEHDSNLNQTTSVEINGVMYKAYDATPSEFTQSGVVVEEDFLADEALNEYLPDSWNNIVADKAAPSNGRTPAPVTGVSMSGNSLSWNQHTDNDIVGYRIYRGDGSRVQSIRGNTSTSTSVSSSGSFFVTAVDSMGRESTASVTAERQAAPSSPPESSEEESDTNDSTSDNTEEEPANGDNNQTENQEEPENNNSDEPDNDRNETDDDSNTNNDSDNNHAENENPGESQENNDQTDD